jgi:hypothetical protein
MPSARECHLREFRRTAAEAKSIIDPARNGNRVSAEAFHSLDKNGVDLLAPAAWQSHRRTLTICLLVLFESRLSNLNDFAAYEILPCGSDAVAV